MRRLLIMALLTLAWLLASPSLQFPESIWLEVGATPATAQETPDIMVPGSPKAKKPAKKAASKKAPPAKAVKKAAPKKVAKKAAPKKAAKKTAKKKAKK